MQSKQRPKPETPNVHISGGHFHQSPIGIGAHITQSLTGTFGNTSIFADLRKTIEDGNLADGDRSKLLVSITEMEKAPDTARFVDRYKDFIAVAANHMALIGPFLPALTALLNGT